MNSWEIWRLEMMRPSKHDVGLSIHVPINNDHLGMVGAPPFMDTPICVCVCVVGGLYHYRPLKHQRNDGSKLGK